MNPRRRTLLFGLPAGLLLPAWAPAIAQPVWVEGQAFERRISLAGAELLLNGTGVRAVAWFKGFAAGLYLREAGRSAAQVLAQTGPKRLQLRMLHDVPADEFMKAFQKGMTRNAAPAELPALAARMELFARRVAALGTVRKGDRVDLDLEPGRGTVFSVNGTLQGEAIVGDDFYAALLRSFVGDRPYDSRLKAGLLGGAV